MWALTVFLAVALLLPLLSSPLSDDPDNELLDEFYDVVKQAFDQHLQNAIREAPESNESDEEELAERHDHLPDSSDTTDKPEEAQVTHQDNHGSGGVNSSPQYPCDRYDEQSRTCVYVRQLGTALTFAVHVTDDPQSKHRIRWFRFFKRKDSESELKEEFTREDLPWNINIGGDNDELRVSPVTETDFSYNYFVATVEIVHKDGVKHKKSRNIRYVKFSIEPIDVDMGVLYHGEELTIHARSFMELPQESVLFLWALGNIHGQGSHDLPSNMKLTDDASSVVIKELRAAGDKVLICSIYTNKNVFVARRNFLIRKINDAGRRNSDEVEYPKLNLIKRRKRSLSEGEIFEGEPSAYQFSPPHWEHVSPDSDRPQPMPHFKHTRYNERSFTDPESDMRKDNRIASPEEEKKLSNPDSPLIDKALFYESDTETSQLNKNPFVNQQHSMNPDVVATSDELEMQDLQNLIKQGNSLSPYGKSPEETILPSEPEKLTFEDKESKLIADCRRDSECNIHAKCHTNPEGQNFCRCSHRYRGNGMFCWTV